MSSLSHAQVQRYYRVVSSIFALLVVLIGAGVAWSGWSSATISITPYSQPVTSTISVSVAPTVSGNDTNQLIGTVTTEQHSASVTVSPKGDGTPVPAHASGMITIKNTTAKVQPLAAGTRLKSSADMIVRTDTRVDVPAGGNVQVNVIADPLGTDGEVQPGQLTIVALWPGLQDKIFGVVDTALTGGLASAGQTLSVDELSAASEQAEQKIRLDIGTSAPGTFFDIQPASVSSNPKSTVASAQYTVTVTTNVTKVTYASDRLLDIIRTELSKSLPEDQQLLSVDTPKLSITDRPSTDQAVIEVRAGGTSSLASNSTLLRNSTYVGLSRGDIEKKVMASTSMQKVAVHFSPLWRTTAPDQANRISVTLQPAEQRKN